MNKNFAQKINFSRALAMGKIEIHADIYKGVVPKNVKSFDELHDYVDANEYAGLCDDSAGQSLDFKIEIQNALDVWIKEGKHISQLDETFTKGTK
jgi:hypothetical protein